jgi:hypothetical protein
MRAEEVKLERLRQRIEDHDWKLIRGQLSIHEHEIANEFKDLDGDSSEDSLTVEPVTGIGETFQLTLDAPASISTLPMPGLEHVVTCLNRCAGSSLISPEPPQAPPSQGEIQGSLLANAASVYGSDADDANTDTSHVERFDAMNKDLGFSADFDDDGIDIDDDDDDDGFDDGF